MDLVDNDKSKGLQVPIWEQYKQIVGNNVQFEMVERFQFYERAKKAFAIVRTGESAIYANIILKKGVVVAKKHPASEDEDTNE
ncbi:unnamed protein product [Rotaria magnacalcarata]|nr:unnamed protein product [Rotaria magnacalcarata]